MKKNQITVNGKVKLLPPHLLKKKNQFQKKKKKKKQKKKNQHVKSATTVLPMMDPQSIAKSNLSSYHGAQQTHADDYISSDTSAEWFDGDEDSDSKAYGPGGYLRVRIGDKLHNRYIIESKLGWGHFSTVWLATDLLAPEQSPRRFVALKIQKSAAHYLDAAKDEIQLLSAAKLKSKDQPENYVVQMLDSFIVSASNGKHVVFVFEVLGQNLLELIKSYNYRGLPMAIVKKIAREVLLGLDYLHSECGIIHTDLKPENVLISRTSAIDREQLKRDKNRQLKAQCQRQLARFEESLQSPNHSMNSSQRKKCRQKVNELKSNIKALDAEWNVMMDSKSMNNGKAQNENQNQQNGHNNDEREEEEEELKENGFNGLKSKNGSHSLSPSDSEMEPQFSWLHRRSLVDGSVLCGEDPSTAALLTAPIAKLCDLGNACWIDKHFTDDITTRQYRAPESIVGVGYGPLVDIWSLAAMLFELITGDYLFDPREKAGVDGGDEGYCRDEDHLALIGELCGHRAVAKGSGNDDDRETEHSPWPLRWTQAMDSRWMIPMEIQHDFESIKRLRQSIKRPGAVAQYFGGHRRVEMKGDGDHRSPSEWEWTERGDQLTRIHKLDYWSLAAVLEEKYKIPHQRRGDRECAAATSGHEEAISGSLAHFLGRMLAVDPRQRATAREMLDHPWLVVTAKDVEQCYLAEKRWAESGGKPLEDTNARYGLNDNQRSDGHHESDVDDEDTVESNPNITDSSSLSMSSDCDNDGDDDDDDDDTDHEMNVISNRIKNKMGHNNDYRNRSRDSSVMARDEFANRRAESEPPPTWHRHLGIPWYRQFYEEEEYLDPMNNGPNDEELDSESGDSTSSTTSHSQSNHEAINGDLHHKMAGLHLNGDDDIESESESDIDIDGDDHKQHHGIHVAVTKYDDGGDDRVSPKEVVAGHYDDEQHLHQRQSSMIFHGDGGDMSVCKGLEVLLDGTEDKDEEDLDDGGDDEYIADGNGHDEALRRRIKDDEMEHKAMDIDVERERQKKEDEQKEDDRIASLPHFPGNGQNVRFSVSVGSTHSRASSSASTFDID